MSRIVLQPKPVGESRFEIFDFISKLGVGETISSQVVTCTVVSGVDPSPSSMISGSATVVNTTQVQQLIQGGVLGVMYDLLATITTSLGQTLDIAAYYSVIPVVP